MIDPPIQVNSYCTRKSLKIEDRLGFGQDGSVWRATATAVKLFDRQAAYCRERDCYKRLAEHQVREINGLSVPRLYDFDDELLIVEMGIVQPPFLLDFGKAHIDRPPDYGETVLQEWDELGQELFESDWETVKELLAALRQYGIYYYDAKPGNIMLR